MSHANRVQLKNKTMRLLITGGGTGGHVYPLFAVLQSLVAEHALVIANDARYLGRAEGFEARLAAKAGIPFVPLRVGGLRALAPWTFARNLALMPHALLQAQKLLAEFKPQAVLATGGYVSAPAIWAAVRARTPIVIYLPDLEPGWAIRLMSRWATCVAVSFDEVQEYFPRDKVVVMGYPVRTEFQQVTKLAGRTHFQLDVTQNVTTIFGGSQGAHSINEAVRANLRELLEYTQVIHVSGRQDEPVLQSFRTALSEEQKARYHLYAYLDEEMSLALAAADLVVARAGAATLGEFPAVGVPSILVPYPFAGRHQDKNADFMVSRGAALKLADAHLATKLVLTVTRLMQDGIQLETMARAARRLAQPHAAKNIANLLKQVADR